MLCQHCHEREATTHLRRTINGATEEYMLCSDCAKEMGVGSIFSDFSTDFNTLLGSFFSNALPARTGAVRCSSCGSTLNDIARTGMVGCADCYETFYSELLPTIRNVHGNTEHCGKHPHRSSEEPSAPQPDDSLDALKAELQQAIDKQDFERAAELRDQIRDKEAQA